MVGQAQPPLRSILLDEPVLTNIFYDSMRWSQQTKYIRENKSGRRFFKELLCWESQALALSRVEGVLYILFM